MSLKQTIEIYELFDNPQINGEKTLALFNHFSAVKAQYTTVQGEKGSTDCIQIVIEGTNGRSQGGTAPTLGIIGRLGGIGARPARIGLVSDADGAIAAVATALKLARMAEKGDRLAGDVIITTHVCANAPTRPHFPVDFMDSPLSMAEMNDYEVLPEMDAILSIDTTKGNRILNHKGYALSPTVKAGYILKVSDDLVRIMEMTSGKAAVTFPITTQDITPYGNGVYHLNSILQPATVTDAPVVGIAICAETVVPGCATGASHETDIALVVKFAVEVAKEYCHGSCCFYDVVEYETLLHLYGSMKHLQK